VRADGPAVYADDIVEEGAQQLLGIDGVLVWVDPIQGGKTRTVLDEMLRDVASVRLAECARQR
jgi:hypothetical protein